MLKWKIGDVTVSRIVELEASFPSGGPESLLPDAYPDKLQAIKWLAPHFITDDAQMKLSIHALLVEVHGQRLIVDTCVGNDKPRNSAFFNKLNLPFLRDLEAAGWARESVDTVLCTHLHVDHVGWNTMLENGKWIPTFPNARYLIGRQELEHWRSVRADPGDAGPILEDSVQPVFDAGLVELVEMDHQVCAEVRLRPTTGHTPGHVSVVIESRGERALITGDCIHHPCQLARPDWSSSFDTDPVASRRTRWDLFNDLASTPTLLIGTHFAAPTAGFVRRDGNAFRLDY